MNAERGQFSRHSLIMTDGRTRPGVAPPATLNGKKPSQISNGVNGLKKEKFPPLDWSNFDTSKESFEEASFLTNALTYFGFYLFMFLGFVNQLFVKPKVATENDRKGYPRLYQQFDQFYSRYVYRRVRDCWNRPICSVPGAELVLKDRVSDDYGWTFRFTGTETRCINLGSYNYLGFAETDGPCADSVEESIRRYGTTLGSARSELGTCSLHVELEELTAKFLGTEAAIVVGMGFATNVLGIPAILGPGCLAISDECNHASIILGLRLSNATIKIFKHNNMKNLEEVIRKAISQGQNRPGEPYKPWRKIILVVEGIYSMEGSIVHLPEIVEIKKKYNCYLYIDEAHSVGAMGKCGRGVTNYFGIDPKEIDILMGTFTKSFASAGGYIAGSQKLIDHINAYGHAKIYASGMSPPVAQQVIYSMKVIMGLDGTNDGQKRIESLARNTRYFRRRLKQMGAIVFGHEDSPIVPMLTYTYSKVWHIIQSLTKSGVAVVGVAFPATPLMSTRIRFCMSAGHSKKQLDYCLELIEQLSHEIGLDYSKLPRDLTPVTY